MNTKDFKRSKWWNARNIGWVVNVILICGVILFHIIFPSDDIKARILNGIFASIFILYISAGSYLNGDTDRRRKVVDDMNEYKAWIKIYVKERIGIDLFAKDEDDEN